jgi:hypothetical protein
MNDVEATNTVLAAVQEINQLRADQQRLQAEMAVLVEALEIIAGQRQCLDNTMSNQAVASWALANTSTAKTKGKAP